MCRYTICIPGDYFDRHDSSGKISFWEDFEPLMMSASLDIVEKSFFNVTSLLWFGDELDWHSSRKFRKICLSKQFVWQWKSSCFDLFFLLFFHLIRFQLDPYFIPYCFFVILALTLVWVIFCFLAWLLTYLIFLIYLISFFWSDFFEFHSCLCVGHFVCLWELHFCCFFCIFVFLAAHVVCRMVNITICTDYFYFFIISIVGQSDFPHISSIKLLRCKTLQNGRSVDSCSNEKDLGWRCQSYVAPILFEHALDMDHRSKEWLVL